MTFVVVHQNIQGVPIHDFFKLNTLHYLHWALLKCITLSCTTKDDGWCWYTENQDYNHVHEKIFESRYIFSVAWAGSVKSTTIPFQIIIMKLCSNVECLYVIVSLSSSIVLCVMHGVANILLVSSEHQSQQILNGVALQNWLEIGNHSPDPMLVWKGEGPSVLIMILIYWYTMVMEWGEWNNINFSNW